MNTMYDYLYSEQTVLSNVLSAYRHPVDKPFGRLMIVGCGSSFNTGKMAEPFFLNYGLSVNVLHPVEFMTTQQQFRADDLVIFISQVGNSALVVKALRSAKGKCITVGLTSNDESLIAKEADYHINIGCGEENWNSKSKGVSCTVLNLLLFGLNSAKNQGLLSAAEVEAETAAIAAVVGKLHAYTAELEPQMEKALSLMTPDSMLWVTSTGYNYAVTREFAMKVTECAYIKATHKEVEEYLHGFEMAADDKDVFLIYGLDATSMELGQGLKAFLAGNGLTERACIFANREGGDIISSVPDDKYNIFVGLVFLQLFSWLLSLQFNIDAKQVRYKNINSFVVTKL